MGQWKTLINVSRIIAISAGANGAQILSMYENMKPDLNVSYRMHSIILSFHSPLFVDVDLSIFYWICIIITPQQHNNVNYCVKCVPILFFMKTYIFI